MSRANFLHGFMIFTFLTGVSGCSGYKEVKDSKEVVEQLKLNNLILSKISESSSEINEHIKKVSLLRLMSLEKDGNVMKIPETPDYIKNDTYLKKVGTIINWSGPVEPVLKDIAKKTKLKYVVRGRKPPSDYIVKLNYIKKPAYQVIEDIGIQLGTDAGIKIVLKGNERKLILTYSKREYNG